MGEWRIDLSKQLQDQPLFLYRILQSIFRFAIPLKNHIKPPHYKLVTVRGHTKKLTNKRGVIEKMQLLEVQKTAKMPFLTIKRLQT